MNKKANRLNVIALTMVLFASWAVTTAQAQTSVAPEEARAIAKEAYVYGFPMVDHYRIQYSYFEDKNDPNYKTPLEPADKRPPAFTRRRTRPSRRPIRTRRTLSSAWICAPSPWCSRCRR